MHTNDKISRYIIPKANNSCLYLFTVNKITEIAVVEMQTWPEGKE